MDRGAWWAAIHRVTKNHTWLSHNTLTLYAAAVAAAARSLQSCPTLCDPTDGSPSGSPIPGILQARTLEWVAISFSNAGKWKVQVKALSRVWIIATSWTAAHQAPASMGFSRQEYWSGVPLPSLHFLWGGANLVRLQRIGKCKIRYEWNVSWGRQKVKAVVESRVLHSRTLKKQIKNDRDFPGGPAVTTLY